MSEILLKYRVTFRYDPYELNESEYDSDDIETIAEMQMENLMEDPVEFMERFKKIPSVDIEEDYDFEVV